MLSVLIPIYNFDIRPLVAELYEELSEMAIDFEIRCYDDGSYFDFKMHNQRVAAYPYVVYKELDENIGRSKIRNLLGAEAAYDYLLFMDCDSQCSETNFIQNYLSQRDENSVVCGGRKYGEEAPADNNLILHWKYGIEKESMDTETRAKKPYKSFMSNSFLIPKKIFNEIKFNEEIVGYGHEDTMFGIDLKERKILIKHIDNPISHLGLKTAHHFLESTHHAVKNLAKLYKDGKVDNSIKLVKAYRTVYLLGLRNKIRKKLDRERNFFVNQLHSPHPDLKKLDKLKLLWFIEEVDLLEKR